MSKFDELWERYRMLAYLDKTDQASLEQLHSKSEVARQIEEYVHTLEKKLGSFNDFYTGDTSYRG